jgi:hypothetical protein
VCVYVFIQDPESDPDPGSDPKLFEKSDPDPKKIHSGSTTLVYRLELLLEGWSGEGEFDILTH